MNQMMQIEENNSGNNAGQDQPDNNKENDNIEMSLHKVSSLHNSRPDRVLSQSQDAVPAQKEASDVAMVEGDSQQPDAIAEVGAKMTILNASAQN